MSSSKTHPNGNGNQPQGVDSDADSEEIEDAITHTRHQMDTTIDRLGEKFSPRNLMDDVISAFTGGSGSQNSTTRAVNAVKDAVQKNPGPAMLVGAGLVWLAVESTKEKDAPADAGLRRQPTRGASLPTTPSRPAVTWRQEVPAWHVDYDWSQSEIGSDQDWNARAEQTLSELTRDDDDNSPPTERVRGAAAKLLALSGHKQREIRSRWASLRQSENGYEDLATGRPYEAHRAEQWRRLAACDSLAGDYEGANDESLSEQATACWNSIRESCRDTTTSTRDKLNNAAQSISDYWTQTGRDVQAGASSAASTVGDWASSAQQGIADAGTYTSDVAKQTGQHIADGAAYTSDVAKQTGRQIADGAVKTKEQAVAAASATRDAVKTACEDYPLAAGAACLGLGLVAGLLVPPTKYEDEAMGEHADRLKESAQQKAEEAVERGQEIAAHTANAAMEEAERQGVTPDQMVETARQSVANVAEAAADEATEQLPDELTEPEEETQSESAEADTKSDSDS